MIPFATVNPTCPPTHPIASFNVCEENTRQRKTKHRLPVVVIDRTSKSDRSIVTVYRNRDVDIVGRLELYVLIWREILGPYEFAGGVVDSVTNDCIIGSGKWL